MTIEADLCAAAARNNAIWCDAMARAHGTPGTLAAAAWINRRPAPRFHPNLVTLGGPSGRPAQIDAVRQLMAAPPAPGWSVKDSFKALELAPLGFDLLFEASWIHRPARPFDRIPSGCRVERVTSEPALDSWEQAWRAGETAPPDRLFHPALLAEPDHAVIALTRDGAIVAGCIASRSDGVLGISNLFVPPDDVTEDDGSLRAACLDAAMRFTPGLPLVGYERGAALVRMTELGFAPIGPLRVWQAT
ncbi:MAG TPA: hypothetical protein VGQ35_21180 [Dongiaceae bacterium]|jgi:hypothetical protein|nr:hypothetical protein [Dongiaceae bacterium]